MSLRLHPPSPARELFVVASVPPSPPAVPTRPGVFLPRGRAAPTPATRTDPDVESGLDVPQHPHTRGGRQGEEGPAVADLRSNRRSLLGRATGTRARGLEEGRGWRGRPPSRCLFRTGRARLPPPSRWCGPAFVPRTKEHLGVAPSCAVDSSIAGWSPPPPPPFSRPAAPRRAAFPDVVAG